MTESEAKNFLIGISYKLGNMAIEYLTEKDGEKMREAIKALEQEPCDDEYIKVPKKALKYRTAGMVAYNAEWLKNHFDIERAVILGCEYKEQEPKTGHWISGICDNCGYDWGKDAPIASVPNFCPNCGACMKDCRTLDEFIEDSKESEGV